MSTRIVVFPHLLAAVANAFRQIKITARAPWSGPRNPSVYAQDAYTAQSESEEIFLLLTAWCFKIQRINIISTFLFESSRKYASKYNVASKVKNTNKYYIVIFSYLFTAYT